MTETDDRRNDMIRKVQALWSKADDAAATDHEREAFAAKARDLMAKWQIDELVLATGSGKREDVIVSDILIERAGQSSDVSDQRIALADYIGRGNRCRCVIRRVPASVDMDGGAIVGGTYLTVCGYRSDVDMVRALFGSLVVDMMMAVADEPISHLGKVQQRNYRENFCDGYAWRIRERLQEINKEVEHIAESSNGMALVLVDRKQAVNDFFSEMFPRLGTQRVKRKEHNEGAVRCGKAAGDSANLSKGGVSGGKRGLNA